MGDEQQVVVVDTERVVEADPHQTYLPSQRRWNAVAVVADVDIAVPTDLADLAVGP